MAVNLEYYRTFYYAASLGNLGRAAEELCLTPPTVTKTIQNLEQQLGCTLFVRTSRGVHLTEAGETLILRVRPAFNLLMAGEHELDMLNSLEAGTVRIAMSEAAAHYFTMPAVFGQFCTRYPKVNLIIEHMTFSATKQSILSGETDFAIMGLSRPEESGEFDIYEIYRSDNIAVVGPKQKRLSGTPVSLEALSAHPLIFVRGNYSIRKYYVEMYARHGLDFKPTIETPTLDMQIKAVKLGLGYSYVPYPHVREDLENGALHRVSIIGERDFSRPVCLITPRGLPMSRAARALTDVLLAAAKSADWIGK